MPRRVNLPGASELFRTTEPATDSAVYETRSDEATIRDQAAKTGPETDGQAAGGALGGPGARTPRRDSADGGRRRARNTGRIRHDEKITVYVSQDELLALEQARLSLRGDHSLAVDRGRIVRAAVASALQQFHDRGEDSDLVRRLSES